MTRARIPRIVKNLGEFPFRLSLSPHPGTKSRIGACLIRSSNAQSETIRRLQLNLVSLRNAPSIGGYIPGDSANFAHFDEILASTERGANFYFGVRINYASETDGRETSADHFWLKSSMIADRWTISQILGREVEILKLQISGSSELCGNL